MSFKTHITSAVAALFSIVCFSQQMDVNGMKVSWEFEENSIRFTASAPDDGWIALGFNSQNNIVNSNLIMVSVSDGKVNAEDFYVVGIGNPKPVAQLGSESQIIRPSGSESNGSTTVSFSLPLAAFDKYHMGFEEGKDLWLICAYSMEDEFDHHSRMRKHVKIEL